MTLFLRSILVAIILVSGSTVLAHAPDAGSEPEKDAGSTTKKSQSGTQA
jgi:hypothetical protein